MLAEIISAITDGIEGFGSAIVSIIQDVITLFYNETGLTILGILGLVFISIGFVGFAFKWVRSFFNK